MRDLTRFSKSVSYNRQWSFLILGESLNIIYALIHLFSDFSYNMAKSSWNELPRLIPERGYHGLATIDGEMYLVGGITTSRAEGREGQTELLDTGKKFILRE